VNTTKVNMGTVEMKCPVPTCDMDGGAPYKTEKLEVDVAMELMRMHNAAAHPAAHPAPARIAGGDGSRFQKLERPVLNTNCSQQDFGFFKDEWKRYAASSRSQDDGQTQGTCKHL
jgi:hypothetical protein